MSRSKQEIIRDIAQQYVQNLTKDYFAEKTAQIDTIIGNKDFSMVNRLLDKIKISPETAQEFFALIINSQDPIKEVLEPLMAAIAGRMFKGWVNKDLKSQIKANIPRYDELSDVFEDTQQFQTTWLRAIAASCAAFLADTLTAKLDVMMEQKNALNADQAEEKEKLREEMEITSQKFANTITKPFDTYFKSIQSPVLLYPTWLRYIYQGLLNIMSFFHRGRNMTIEQKVDGLYLAAEAAQNTIKQFLESISVESPEARPFIALNEQLVRLKSNLNSLATEIQDKKAAQIDYEDYAQTAFRSFTQNFANFIRTQQLTLPQLPQEGNAQVLNEVINTLLHKNPILARQIIENADSHASPRTISADKKASQTTSADYTAVPSEDLDEEDMSKKKKI